MFEFQPTLQNEVLKLTPLKAQDFEPLYALASDPLVWEQHALNNRYERDVFQKYFEDGLKSGGALLVSALDGEVVGTSRFYDYDPENSIVVIGYTFIGRKYWGGDINRELKQLMLTHAFKFVDRVHFHISERNFRSQQATQKVGAKLVSRVLVSDKPRLIYEIQQNQLS